LGTQTGNFLFFALNLWICVHRLLSFETQLPVPDHHFIIWNCLTS
jgi:hypothetical protein